MGTVLLFLGLFMATSLVWAWLDRAEFDVVVPWLSAVLATVGPAGAALLWARHRGNRDRRFGHDGHGQAGLEITRREALVIVSLSWIACGVFGGLPLLLDGMVSNPIDALFEATSGFTTTGSTILTEIEGNTRASLWWRSMIQWLGGMGIVVLFVAVFPQVGAGGRLLFESESPGPTKDQLQPRIRETGATLWRIYLGLTGSLAALLWLEGMSLFDALCHAMTTMATGGFSTRNASIAGFDSWQIDVTVTVFMLLAGVNFGIYYALLRRRQGLRPLRDAELLTYLGVFVAGTVVVTITLLGRFQGNVLEALRYASFQVASLGTSTGFGTDDFVVWPPLGQAVLLSLMFVGGMGGSTAGGFKVSRAMICGRAAVQQVLLSVHPNAIFGTRLGGRTIEDRVVRAAVAMAVIAIGVLAAGTLSLTGMGMAVETAFSAVLTAMFNSGPGLNELGPTGNFSEVPRAGKVLLSFVMVLGRLEFITLLALLLPSFWRGR